MGRAIFVLIVALVFGGVAKSQEPITYFIGAGAEPDTHGGVSTRGHLIPFYGAITTDGKLGAIAAADILSWNAVPAGSSSDPGAFVIADGVIATPDKLLLQDGGVFGLFGNEFFGSDMTWARTAFNTGFSGLVTPGGPDFFDVPFPWGFDSQGNAIIAIAPEPATLTLLAIGIAGMAGYGWRWRCN